MENHNNVVMIMQTWYMATECREIRLDGRRLNLMCKVNELQ